MQNIQERLGLLESRVQEMIDLIRRIKAEKDALQNRLNQRETELHQLSEEKHLVFQRLEKILEVLHHPESLLADVPLGIEGDGHA